ncbi:profilin [Thelephora terrestris]|uniref:Profilin n=1 Tax=Thelephora terrestris TaxID=56493 RepID=A0A9P6H7V1_9AGAM|nr:profilin [Thelephora terrestris]
MSWQAYVDTNLVGTGVVKKAAILGQAGGVWATTAGYTLSPEEQKAVINAFKNPESAQSSGVRLAGQKFFTLSVSDRSIYCKKQADGCLLVKTKQAVLVAEYVAPVQQAEAVKIVEGLADYLISVGY